MFNVKFIIFLLIPLPIPIIRTANGRQQNSLANLRRFTAKGVAGRFVVDRKALEQEIQIRKQQNSACGEAVKIQLPHSLPHAPYNESFQGEVTLGAFTITDLTLEEELADELKENITTSHYFVGVDLPVVIGEAETHGLLPLYHFTNNTKKIIFSGRSNNGDFIQVNSIEEADDGTVTIRLSDDVMVYQPQGDMKCEGNANVGKDFDKITSKVMRITDYPLPFDWGCELLGANISFCQRLDGFRCELARAGRDVCIVTSTTKSKRSPITIKIIKMTGKFREMIPFLAETIPNESFEAEWVDREHMTGITFPCLTA